MASWEVHSVLDQEAGFDSKAAHHFEHSPSLDSDRGVKYHRHTHRLPTPWGEPWLSHTINVK